MASFQVECVVEIAGYVWVNAINKAEAIALVESKQFNDTDFEVDEFSEILDVTDVIDVIEVS